MHSLAPGVGRRVPIRAKLAATLAVPLVGLLAFSTLEVRQTALDAAEVRDETRLARSATGPTGIVTRLQDERIWASLELNGLESSYEAPMEGYTETRAATDEAIQGFRAEIDAEGGAVEATFRATVDDLDRLEAIRQEIDGHTGPRTLDSMPFATEIYDRYAELILGLLDASSAITPQVRDADLRQGTELAGHASRLIELSADLSRQTVVDAMQSPNGIDTPTEVTRVSMLLSSFNRNNEQFESATGRYAAIVREHFPREMADLLGANVEGAIASGTVEDLDSFLAGVAPLPGEGYWALQDELFDAIAERADALNAEATARQRLFAVLALVCFVLAAAVTWLVSRSITEPLRSLTRQAKEMADIRLPEAVRRILDTPPGQDVEVPHVPPVAVRTRDEVSDVSEALNTVQQSALDLAVEQAVLRRNIADSFVNLGRRNQNLLVRQLDFITELESNETDPDTLASLFRLDHLATRMRRNAESLLVLAGVDPPRRWSAPVRLTDVIRAALGEVEDYRRAGIAEVQPVTVVGALATDLAHLVAELLENALTFSSPQDQVVLWGWWLAPDTYRLVVVDHGLGMPGPDLEQANRRLAGSESFTVAPSKYLGHYVAGHLASRHGIRVHLEAATSRGTVAAVDLPSGLLTQEVPPAAQAALPSGQVVGVEAQAMPWAP